MPNERTKMMTFRLTDLAEPLRVRGGPSVRVLRPMVNRYLWLLSRAREKLDFTRAEALAICHALKGTQHIELKQIRFLWAEVQEACSDGFAKRFGANCEALVSKLQGLNDTELMAVVDAAEVFWRLPQGDDAQKVKEAGLVRD